MSARTELGAVHPMLWGLNPRAQQGPQQGTGSVLAVGTHSSSKQVSRHNSTRNRAVVWDMADGGGVAANRVMLLQ